MKFLLLLFFLTSIKGVKKLEWVDPYGRNPTRYKRWCKLHYVEKKETRITTVYELIKQNKQNLVDIVINSGIYPYISSEIETFSQDLINDGYSVRVDTISGMDHVVLRNHLASLLPQGLVGAIFVGEVPVAWFETNGFGTWEEYPHDLYFCDLDGTYVDNDGDGIYDDHTGSVEPEIWAGRIYARNLTWDNEIRLLKRYFRKNHLYRVDSLSLPQRGLSFVDDDWSSWATCGLDLIYSDVVVINDNYQTTASNYRNQLVQGYEWIHICAHSSPWGHTFKYPPDQYKGTVFNYEIYVLEPRALFYNLFACSGTRFVEENYSAGWYIFNDSAGLVAVGSAKTGSMLAFDDFYGPIGQQNMCIGDAFKYWFTLHGEEDWDWFYGLNILGDPTLKPKSSSNTKLIQKTPALSLLNEYPGGWEQPEIICPDSESDGFPKITTNLDGRIWVIWESGRSYTNGRSEIYAAFRDGTWSGEMCVGPFKYWDYGPAIGIDKYNRPVAVWAGWENISGNCQYDIFYSVYDTSWSERQILHPLDPAYDLRPSLTKDSTDYLWVSWESRRNLNSDIYAAYFDGNTWSSPQQVTSDNTDETNPEMVCDTQGRIWVFYSKKYSDHSEIWGSYYNETKWVESGPISGNQRMTYHPAAALGKDGKIWVAWQTNDPGNPDIFASYFDGNTWSPPVQITENPEPDLFPDLTNDTNGLVWLVYQSKSKDGWDIYSAYCSDSIWSAPEIVANLDGADINPQITCSISNELWVTWQSYINGNWEILVTHKPSTVINEDIDLSLKNKFRVSSTIFSKNLKIITPKPFQEIKIFDVKGACIEKIYSDANKIAILERENKSPGVYILLLKNGNTQISKKIILTPH